METLIENVEGQKFGEVVVFHFQVEPMLWESHSATSPAGNKHPASVPLNVTQFIRDPAVATWVLKAEKGICECCKSRAPFSSEDGTDYLEVHHIVRLADGGADTISNAVAVCPNCHRELHYGKRKELLASTLQKAKGRIKKPSQG